ncbi:MAG TPA: glutathione S-transferase family protein [Steroidobacteraceae bacterium]|jgi:glutathione S-transferase|nr:glutathione S-transferase family protein [Steroidobacteraceae bacterium]
MNTGYKLYGRPGSGSLAVQIALEEIGAPFERIWVGSEASDVARFRATNPTGRVPALMLPDGTVMFESAAILIHLALCYPKSGLAPQPGTSRHAAFLQWMVFLSANLYEAVLRIYYSTRFSTRGDADAQAIREQGTTDYGACLALVSERLGPYVLGGSYSIADVYLHMLVSWQPGDSTELYRRLPKLEAHAKIVGARPAVVKVEADHAR